MIKNKIIIILLSLLLFQVLNGCIEYNSVHNQVNSKEMTNSIQTIIDKANEGDIVKISPGIYNGTIIIDKSIKLIATDKNSTIITYSGNKSDISIITIIEDNCSIDGFKIINNNTSINSNGIKVSSSNNVISNNKIQNFNYGVFLENSNYNKILNNTFFNNANGLYMTYSIYNEVISNNFLNNYKYGLFASSQSNKNTFKLNFLSNNFNGLRVRASQQNQIEKNMINNSTRRGIYLCCGTSNNYLFNNSLINNNPNADDKYNNQWYFNKIGNYWGDYKSKYPDAIDENDDGIWDFPYIIYEDKKDLYPLVSPVSFS